MDLIYLDYFDSFLAFAADTVMKDHTKEKHFHRQDAVNHPTDWTCSYCNKTFKCLIAHGHAREHLAGESNNVAACKLVPEAVFN